jgi:DNA repair protein RecN (Recombination protein N)
MLRRLLIENYGLIERAEIAFAEGATIFTGETGSGKTMILGALAFALGARASADAVRRGAARAAVTLTFEPDAALRERFAADGFDVDEGEEASFAREVTDAGKSSMRVNGRAATAGYARELAPLVAEIVGQHEAQRLLAPAYHLELLDRFGGADACLARAEVREAYERAARASRAVAELAGDERRALERYEDARFAADEIASAQPEPGEDERLTRRRRLLDNVEHVAAALRIAHDALAGDEASASSALGAAGVALGGIASMSAELAAMAEQAAVFQDEARELAVKINARLDVLDRVKRKYGGSIEAVLAHRASAQEIVRSYEARDERAAELAAEAAEARRSLELAAASLTSIRVREAARLCAAVQAEFADLALASGRLDVALERRDGAALCGQRGRAAAAARAGRVGRGALARAARARGRARGGARADGTGLR